MKNTRAIIFSTIVSLSVLLGCNNGNSSKSEAQTTQEVQENPLLTQEEAETFIRRNIPTSYSTSFDNGRGFTHSAQWTSMTITEIGVIAIVDEYNLKTYAKFSLNEKYSYGSGDSENNTKDVWLRFNFTKSTDGKWYLKSVDRSNTGDRALNNLANKIFKSLSNSKHK